MALLRAASESRFSRSGSGGRGNAHGPNLGNETGIKEYTLPISAIDVNTGEPIEDASVYVVTYDRGADVVDETTDADGQVQFEGPNSNYEVGVSKRGYGQPSDNRFVAVTGEDTKPRTG